MEYDIIMTRLIGELNKQINEKISQGWEPIGGVSAVHETNSQVSGKIQYLQAIIRR